MTGGSASTAGNSDYVAGVVGGGRIDLNGTVISTIADGSGGVFINGAGGVLNATGVTITTHGGVDSSTGDTADGAYNGSYPGYPQGGAMTLTDTTILTSGSHAFGVQSNSSGVTTVNGGSVSTSGVFAHGILTQGLGTSVSVTGTAITTSGNGSVGADLVGTGSAMTLSNVSITTSGTTDGGGAQRRRRRSTAPRPRGISSAAERSTIAELDHQDLRRLCERRGHRERRPDDGPRRLDFDLRLSSLRDRLGHWRNHHCGPSSVGPTTITTGGNDAPVVVAQSGGFVSLQGPRSRRPAPWDLSGLVIHDAGSELDATNVTVTTQGGSDSETGRASYGLFNGPRGSSVAGGVAKITNSSISTQGLLMYGVYTDAGGTTTLTGTSVSTAGVHALGLLSDHGGVTNVIGGSISTTGAAAYAVAVNHGGAISLNGTTVAATGAGSGGLGINGAASTLNATGVTISTMGGYDPVSGQNAYGVYNGPYGNSPSGGAASLINSSVATSAAQMVGVYTTTGGTTTLAGANVTTLGVGAAGVESIAGGVTNISGGSVATAGQDAHALFVTGAGSQGNLSGTGTFATQGPGAIGLYATLGGVISSTGSTTIATAGGVSPATGLGAFGVNADGAGSQIRLGAATITTSGAGAFGLYASDAAGSGNAGSIAATGTLNVTTTNAAATAVGLQGNGASIAATGGGTIVSVGDAISLSGGTNQTATFDNFTIGKQTGDLIFADPSVSTVNFNNTTADAGLNNLLDATGGSIITLNANASILTGAIRTNSSRPPTSTFRTGQHGT